MSHKPATTNPLIHALDFITQRVEEVSFTEWLTARRAAGDSYQTIAEDVTMLTDGFLHLSDETISRYCRELNVEDSAA